MKDQYTRPLAGGGNGKKAVRLRMCHGAFFSSSASSLWDCSTPQKIAIGYRLSAIGYCYHNFSFGVPFSNIAERFRNFT
jgi:hypothetical protein